MADILTLTFRTLMSEPGPKRSASPSGSTLLVGDRTISRSVLLLAAVTAASELGSRVAFFTRTQIQSLPAPLHTRLPNQSPDGLKRITFCYPTTAEELLQQVARLHEATPPSLIVLDRLEAYLCAEPRPGPDGSATDPVLDVLRRYFQMLCTLDRDRDRGHEAAAAGLQERWHVELSGEAWHLLVHPGGAMEFKMPSLTDLC